MQSAAVSRRSIQLRFCVPSRVQSSSHLFHRSKHDERPSNWPIRPLRRPAGRQRRIRPRRRQRIRRRSSWIWSHSGIRRRPVLRRRCPRRIWSAAVCGPQLPGEIFTLGPPPLPGTSRFLLNLLSSHQGAVPLRNYLAILRLRISTNIYTVGNVQVSCYTPD